MLEEVSNGIYWGVTRKKEINGSFLKVFGEVSRGIRRGISNGKYEEISDSTQARFCRRISRQILEEIVEKFLSFSRCVNRNFKFSKITPNKISDGIHGRFSEKNPEKNTEKKS